MPKKPRNDEKSRTRWDDVRWTPFTQREFAYDTPQELRDYYNENKILLYRNSIYQVEVRGILVPPPFGKTLWLSCKTLDRQPRHDWRELQRIKNELVGEEMEAVELYPSETRTVDTSNQYHLWCFPNLEFPKHQLPFGYKERLVSEGSSIGINSTGVGFRQRDFREEFKPVDLVRNDLLPGMSLSLKSSVGGRCPNDWSPIVYSDEVIEVEYGGQKVKMWKAKCLKAGHVMLISGKDRIP